QLPIKLRGLDEAGGIAAGIDADRLVEVRRALAGQGIVAELVIQLAVAGAGGEAQLARGQLDQPALKVGLGDRLTDRRAVLEVGADGLLAVLRDVLPRG